MSAMTDVPPVDEMLEMKFTSLVTLCQSLNLEGDFNIHYDCLKVLLKHYSEKGLISPEGPVRIPGANLYGVARCPRLLFR